MSIADEKSFVIMDELGSGTDPTEGILNARMAFDKEALRPTYQMIIGDSVIG